MAKITDLSKDVFPLVHPPKQPQKLAGAVQIVTGLSALRRHHNQAFQRTVLILNKTLLITNYFHRLFFYMEALDILGLTAGSISGITFIPQVIKTWKTKSADDISLLMFTFATLSVIMWLVYGLIKKDIAIIYTNSLVLICSLVMLYFKFRYSRKKA